MAYDVLACESISHLVHNKLLVWPTYDALAYESISHLVYDKLLAYALNSLLNERALLQRN